ncbi:MAG: nicotinate phosphoribosyltransferase [bacterium]|nr:nicotinate phosphoribosyltransferase [bacterium]
MSTPDTTTGILFTDQYQLTMAQTYFRKGLHERPAQFDYTFRSYPDYGTHQAGYCIFAGLDPLLEWMETAHFGPDEIELLAGQRTSTGTPRFDVDFLDWLADSGHFGGIEVRAVAEGRVVHPLAPLAIVTGPLAMGQILETALLNRLNYPTLIATKASRVHESGRGRPVLEFGMRRGPAEGANSGSRAALIGGADFSSNVGVSHAVGVDPKGTHAHSLVQAFMALGGGELEAFRAFAESYPDDCILLVDTINTLKSGVPNAITVFGELRAAGHQPGGIRLDSGDLAYLSIQAAKQLNDAGFEDVSIVLSSNLDELAMWQIIGQIEEEAPRYGVDPQALIGRLSYGVGTRLITSRGHAALDGVCKLVAIEDKGRWVPAIKVSDSPGKIPTPGLKQVWRVKDSRGYSTADVIATAEEPPPGNGDLVLHHPNREGVQRTMRAADVAGVESLLEPVFRDRKRLGSPTIAEMRERRRADVELLDPGVRRLVNPHVYHVSLTQQMKDLQRRLVAEARSKQPPAQ